jgi:hypothetical protein
MTTEERSKEPMSNLQPEVETDERLTAWDIAKVVGILLFFVVALVAAVNSLCSEDE